MRQPGDAATVMNFEQNFGQLLAMAGFVPTAEFYQGSTQMQVKGAYLNLPGSAPIQTLNVAIAGPAEGGLVNGTVEITATTFGTVDADQVEFFANGTSIGTDFDGSDGWKVDWDTTELTNGDYPLTAVATSGGLSATSSPVSVTVNNAGQPQPTVTLTAAPGTVASGGSSTLSWSSTNADSCAASNGWTGNKSTSGSESVSPAKTTT